MLRKTFAILFLISFTGGLIRPVLPMVEYYLFKESIIELFCVNRDVPESDCEGICYLSDRLEENSKQAQGDQVLLINVEEIPVFVLTGLIAISDRQPPAKDPAAREKHRLCDGLRNEPFHPPRG